MKTAVRFACRFFTLALLQALVCFQNAPCQQAADLVFTNKFATFTNLQSETFISAELIEADATQVVFKTNDIFGAVKFTNLSTATLETLGIPLSRLSLAHELEVQKAEAIAKQREILAEEQSQLANPSNLAPFKIQTVIYKDYDPIYGMLNWCNVKQDNGQVFAVFVARLPEAVQAFFEQRAALENSIAQLNGQIDRATAQISTANANIRNAQYQVDMANANPPTGAYTGNPATDDQISQTVTALQNQNATRQVQINATRDSVADTQSQVEDSKAQLSQKQNELEALNRSESSVVSVLTLRSHYLHNRFPVLICAPPQARPFGDSQ